MSICFSPFIMLHNICNQIVTSSPELCLRIDWSNAEWWLLFLVGKYLNKRSLSLGTEWWDCRRLTESKMIVVPLSRKRWRVHSMIRAGRWTDSSLWWLLGWWIYFNWWLASCRWTDSGSNLRLTVVDETEWCSIECSFF